MISLQTHQKLALSSEWWHVSTTQRKTSQKTAPTLFWSTFFLCHLWSPLASNWKLLLHSLTVNALVLDRSPSFKHSSGSVGLAVTFLICLHKDRYIEHPGGGNVHNHPCFALCRESGWIYCYCVTLYGWWFLPAAWGMSCNYSVHHKIFSSSAIMMNGTYNDHNGLNRVLAWHLNVASGLMGYSTVAAYWPLIWGRAGGRTILCVTPGVLPIGLGGWDRRSAWGGRTAHQTCVGKR